MPSHPDPNPQPASLFEPVLIVIAGVITIAAIMAALGFTGLVGVNQGARDAWDRNEAMLDVVEVRILSVEPASNDGLYVNFEATTTNARGNISQWGQHYEDSAYLRRLANGELVPAWSTGEETRLRLPRPSTIPPWTWICLGLIAVLIFAAAYRAHQLRNPKAPKPKPALAPPTTPPLPPTQPDPTPPTTTTPSTPFTPGKTPPTRPTPPTTRPE